LTDLDELITIFSSVLNGYMDGGPYQEKEGEKWKIFAAVFATGGG
jgi:hypothetical protein